MNEPALWMLSISAFTAVMVLLALLSLAIRFLTLVFRPPPAPPATAAAVAAGDPAVVAAIQATVQRLLPGARVTSVIALADDRPGAEDAR